MGETKIQKEMQADPTLTQGQNLSQTLAQLTASESQAYLIGYIQERVAATIGISASQIDIQQPLNYMGIDSLIAVKLRNRLRTDLEIDVSAVKFMGDSSITSLAIEVSDSLLDAHFRRAESVFQSHIPSFDEKKATLINTSDSDWLEGEI